MLSREGQNLKETEDCKVASGENVAKQYQVSKVGARIKWWKLKMEELYIEFREELRKILGGRKELAANWESIAEKLRELPRACLVPLDRGKRTKTLVGGTRKYRKEFKGRGWQK